MRLSYKKGEVISPKQAQALCIQEAKKGSGWVSPNPLVGCVVVDEEHKFLSSGYHEKFGAAHAEINALRSLSKDEIKNAILYVTLEPCAHEGKTPSCAKFLSQTNIAKVVCGLKDPNPLVSGKGFEILNAAGIQVYLDEEFAKDCARLTEIFLYNMKKNSVFISLKIATSLDGRIALENGESKWITSEESRLKARELRAHYDATMIGARTLIADDPLLDFRGTSFVKKQNKIVIWDPKGIIGQQQLESSQIFKIHGASNIYLITSKKSGNTGVECCVSEDLSDEVFSWLYSKGIYSIYVEGGAHTVGQLLKSKCYQKLYNFMAPKIIGAGKCWSQGMRLGSLSEAPQLNIDETHLLGSDLLIVLRPNPNI